MKYKSNMNKPKTVVAVAALAGALVAPQAMAASDDYQPLGLRAGNFTFFPAATLGGEFNDNIFAADANEESDFIVHFKPSIEARGKLSGGSTLDFYLNSHLGAYTDFDDENFSDVALGMRSRAVLQRGMFFSSAAGYKYGHEARGDVNTSIGSEPVTYNEVTAMMEFEVKPARTGFRVWVDTKGEFYNDQEDTPNIDLMHEERNRWDVSYNAELSQDLDASTGVFVQVGGTNIGYTDRDLNAFPDRDSSGFRAVLGARAKASGVLDLEAYAGYLTRVYEDPGLSSLDGFTAGAGLTWTPTPLAEITFNGDRTLQETTANLYSGFIATDVELGVTLFPADNVQLWGEIGYLNRDYEANGVALERDDDEFSGEIGGRLLINRNFNMGAYYNIRNRESSLPGLDYTQNRFMLEISGAL